MKEMFLVNLLSSSASDSASDTASSDNTGWLSIVLIGVLVVAFVVMMFFSNRSNKKRQQEQEAAVNAIRPGNKVKTIGGVCGIVVEVNDEENTLVIETGNELNGKSYLKFDKGAIYQTDAKPEKTEEKGKNKDGKEEQKDDAADKETSEPASETAGQQPAADAPDSSAAADFPEEK